MYGVTILKVLTRGFYGIRFTNRKRGNIPDSKRTNACTLTEDGDTTIISNSIGQGEVLMTPIQLASMMATVANEGYYYTPHHQKKLREQQLTLNLR
jgi:penicillin-binding protein 2